MYKILTQNGILTTTSEATAKTIAKNAAISGETAVLATATCEYLVIRENLRVMAYDVADMWEKGNDSLILAYRETCFSAHAAEERKSQEAARKTAASTSNPSKGRNDDLLKDIFNQFFGDFVTPKKK